MKKYSYTRALRLDDAADAREGATRMREIVREIARFAVINRAYETVRCAINLVAYLANANVSYSACDNPRAVDTDR